MVNIKVGVEVASAHDLMPKDVEGSASPFVELHLDHQKIRTTVKQKDLNPFWNETFYFNISDPDNISDLTLEAYVYNNVKGNISNPNCFMGKVHINGTSFVPYSEAVVSHYPLQKRSILCRVKGEIGLKVFIIDINPSIMIMRSLNIIPQMETSSYEHDDHQQQQSHFPSQMAPINQPQGPQFAYQDTRNQTHEPKVGPTNSSSSSPSEPLEYPNKETSPVLLGSGKMIMGARVVNSDNNIMYDLVEPMQFLFVRVVKAQDLPVKAGSLDRFVQVGVGNYKEITQQHFSKTSNAEWNTVFAFAKERILQASVLNVMVKDKDMTVEDDFIGIVRVNLRVILTRFSSDSLLAPEWYRLEDKKGDKLKKGELMLAVWIGTHADEAFPDAFFPDAAMSNDADSNLVSSMYTRLKVYDSPRFWYVRVNIIEAQINNQVCGDEKNRFPYVRVKAQINKQVSRTRPVQVRGSASAFWMEDLMFVAAEPFEDQLILTVEDRVGPGKDETLGKVFIPLNSVERRADDRIVNSTWYDLQPDPVDNEIDDDQKKKKNKKKDKLIATRLHLRVCLDGGYHVVDESTQYSSDLRPSARELWEPSIGILDLGILNASSLEPMKTTPDGKGTVDAYCIAKYGHNWVRTRTVVDNLSPRFNEQYTWEVYDPSTVVTVGVFHNAQLDNRDSKDVWIGRIRIHISTLVTGHVYTHSYPLLVLHPTLGVKKMGELQLSIQFSDISKMKTLLMYLKPLLPKMNYQRPLSAVQLEMLRQQAVGMVADELGQEEPPLGREVVEYMMMTEDAKDSHLWRRSMMRRSKVNYFRLMLLFDRVVAVSKWFKQICSWKDGMMTVLAHLYVAMFVSFPEVIPLAFCMYMILFILWNLRLRDQYPPHTRPSYVDDKLEFDELDLDKEFDHIFQLAASQSRLESVGSVAASEQIQSFIGDTVSLAEQLQWLLTSRDTRATLIALMVFSAAMIVVSVMPFRVFQVLVIATGFYVMRHPRFHHRLPSAPLNFFRRLPPNTHFHI